MGGSAQFASIIQPSWKLFVDDFVTISIVTKLYLHISKDLVRVH